MAVESVSRSTIRSHRTWSEQRPDWSYVEELLRKHGLGCVPQLFRNWCLFSSMLPCGGAPMTTPFDLDSAGWWMESTCFN